MGFTVKKVLIEGEIPTNCGDCPLCVGCWGDGRTCATTQINLSQASISWATTRPDWCPLIAESIYAINIIQEYIS